LPNESLHRTVPVTIPFSVVHSILILFDFYQAEIPCVLTNAAKTLKSEYTYER